MTTCLCILALGLSKQRHHVMTCRNLQALGTADVRLLVPTDEAPVKQEHRGRAAASPRALADPFKFLDPLRLQLPGVAAAIVRAGAPVKGSAAAALHGRVRATLLAISLILHQAHHQVRSNYHVLEHLNSADGTC
jgi:hypothetical protein